MDSNGANLRETTLFTLARGKNADEGAFLRYRDESIWETKELKKQVSFMEEESGPLQKARL